MASWPAAFTRVTESFPDEPSRDALYEAGVSYGRLGGIPAVAQ